MNDNLIPKTDGQTGGQNGTPTNLPGANFTNSNLSSNTTGSTNTETTPAFIGMNSPVSSHQSQPAKPIEHPVPAEPVKPVQNSVPSASVPPTPSAPIQPTPSATIQPMPSATIQPMPSAFALHTSSTSSTFSNSTPPVGTARPSAYTPVTHITTNPHSMAKVWWTIISIFIISILAGGGYYFYATQPTPVPDEVPLEDNRSLFPTAVTGTNPRPVATSTQQAPSRVPTARESFNTYIRQNINSLSPIKTTGTFTVSSVRFDGANRAIVTYTDGRNTYNAAVNYAVNGINVTVTNFTVLTK